MLHSLALAVALAAPASSGDWFASLYTGEGVELRNDERVFALFAAFNATGFDEGPVTRREPVPKVAYHPVRQAVRARVLGADPEARRAVEAFFDAHPVSLEKYLAYAVGSKSKDASEVKGFEVVLAKAASAWHLDELMAQTQRDSRAAHKAYLGVIDAPLAKARAALKVADTTQTVLVVNLLDAQGHTRAVQGEGGEVLVVVGPLDKDKPNVEGVLREFARVAIEPAVMKKVSSAGWPGGAAVLREAQALGVSDPTVQAYATSLFTQAVALNAMNAPAAVYDDVAARGYFGVREIAKMFDDGKPFEGWVLEGLQRVEARRPAKK